MELTVNIGYNEVLHLVKQLPLNKIKQLQVAMEQEFVVKKTNNEITSFQKFLLNGPVMTDEQYNDFKDNRKIFNQWRTMK